MPTAKCGEHRHRGTCGRHSTRWSSLSTGPTPLARVGADQARSARPVSGRQLRVAVVVDQSIPAAMHLYIRLRHGHGRSEEHTSELQSLMRISYAVFCLKKKKTHPMYKI